MKTRIITGALLFLFVTPFIIFGTYSMAVFVLLLMTLGMIEFLNVKKNANLNKYPIYMYVLTIIFAFLIIFDIPLFTGSFNYQTGVLDAYIVNPLWIVLSAVVILSCSVFDKRYSIIDSIYAFTTMLYLSLGLKGMLYLRSVGGVENINHGTMVIVYVLLVTCLTDIFAYFGGMTCYKLLGADKVHKLNERISPKKTIEGTIIGTLFGTGLGFLFAMLALKNVDLGIAHWSIYLLMSFVLSICGQIGDLVLSAVKRHFAIKDYSNLLPGHGGVLDRIDSLLLNSMIAAIFLVTMSYIL